MRSKGITCIHFSLQMYSFATYYYKSYFDAHKIFSLSAIFLIFEQCISYLHDQVNSHYSMELSLNGDTT